MVNQITPDIRLLVLSPTILYLASVAASYMLQKRAERQVLSSVSAGSPIVDELGRDYNFTLFIESLTLGIINGLAVTSELGHVTIGTTMLLAGVLLSALGLVATEAQSTNGKLFALFFLALTFIFEVSYFLLFGTSWLVGGVILSPELVSGLVVAVIFLLVVIGGIWTSQRAKAKIRT